MLERFTARARRSVVLATEEARRRGHEGIGPEHLLMGMLRDGEGMAVKVLERLGAASETLRADVERLLSATSRSSTASEPIFSPELRNVFRTAFEARRQSSHLIGTENLLLGVLAQGSEAGRVLRTAGVSLEGARGVISGFYDTGPTPITAESLRYIALSQWRLQM